MCITFNLQINKSFVRIESAKLIYLHDINIHWCLDFCQLKNALILQNNLFIWIKWFSEKVFRKLYHHACNDWLSNVARF